MINNEFPPIGGGGSTVNKYVLKHLVARGHNVTLITSSYKNLPRREIIDGATVIRVPAVRRYKDYCAPWELVTFGISASWYCLWNMQRIRPDVIQAFFAVPAGFVAYVMRAVYAIPYVVCFGGSDMPEGNPSRFTSLYPFITPLIRRIWRRASAATVCSRGLLVLGRKHDPSYPFRFIPNGVDTSRFTPKERIQEKIVKILFVGRLIERKGLQDVVKALPLIKEQVRVPFELCVAGTGEMQQALEALAEKLHVSSHIRYIGDIPQERIHKAYQDADVFILPSKSEGMPVVTLEAMASGLPIVTTDVPGNSEIVKEGKNGYLVSVGDVDAIANSLISLIKDKTIRMRMGKESRSKAESFDWSNVVREYEEVLERI